MKEREIKFFLPPSSLKALQNKSFQSNPLHLVACYFDTQEWEFAQNKAALRLRLENKQWIQTFKMLAAHPLERIEINTPRAEKTLDLTVYEHTEANSLINSVQNHLKLQFETDIKRYLFEEKKKNSLIEGALDVGMIKANGLTFPVSEIEFELKQGDLKDLLLYCHEWIKQYPLVLDLRSKAQQGIQLAQYQADENTTADELNRALHNKVDYHDLTKEALQNASLKERQTYLKQEWALLCHQSACLAQLAESNLSTSIALPLLTAICTHLKTLHQILVLSQQKQLSKQAEALVIRLQILQDLLAQSDSILVSIQAQKVIAEYDFQAFLLRILAYQLEQSVE